MKKYFAKALFFSFFLLALVFPKNSYAQGTFACEWVAGGCTFKASDGLLCQQGYIPDDLLCAGIEDEDSCNRITSAQCIQDVAGDVEGWACSSGSCFPCAADSPNCQFSSGVQCNAACGGVPAPTTPPEDLSELASCNVEIYYDAGYDQQGDICDNCFQVGNYTYTLKITDAVDGAGNPYSSGYDINISPGFNNKTGPFFMNNGNGLERFGPIGESYEGQIMTVQIVRRFLNVTNTYVACETTIGPIAPRGACDYANQCTYDPDDQEIPGAVPFRLCDQIPDPQQKLLCKECALQGGTEDNAGGVWTAIGCISREPENIIARFITLGLGIGGGVALLMFLVASFMLTTSQGEPKRASDAREMATASVVGLIFVIFSVSILQFIGVTVLRIPGFGG